MPSKRQREEAPEEAFPRGGGKALKAAEDDEVPALFASKPKSKNSRHKSLFGGQVGKGRGFLARRLASTAVLRARAGDLAVGGGALLAPSRRERDTHNLLYRVKPWLHAPGLRRAAAGLATRAAAPCSAGAGVRPTTGLAPDPCFRDHASLPRAWSLATRALAASLVTSARVPYTSRGPFPGAH